MAKGGGSERRGRKGCRKEEHSPRGSHCNLKRAGLTLKFEHGYSQLAIFQLLDTRCRHGDLLDIRSE